MSASRTRHPLAWLAWLAAVLAWLIVARNPLYLVVLLLDLGLVLAALPVPAGTGRLPLSPWRFGLLVVPLAALFNALSVHVGQTVLLRLPPTWPLVGGPITLEALLFGALNGLVLAGLVAAFAVLNRAVAARVLLRYVPRAFFPVALVVVIALSFVPATLHQWAAIREAQAVRGHRVRGPRDWLPLFVPLLVGGLERALQLAEAMTARGFAAHSAPLPPRVRALVVAGLAGVLAGWLLQLGWGVAWGYALMALGAAAVAVALRQAGRTVPHTSYRTTPWQQRDSVLLGAALVALLPLLLPLDVRRSLFYYPYPVLVSPPFDPRLVPSLLALAAPVVLLPSQSMVGGRGEHRE